MNTEDTAPFSTSDVERMVAHMNDDHADSVLAYLRHYGNCPEATGGRLPDVTARDMRIEADTPGGPREIVIPFLTTPSPPPTTPT